MAFVITSPCSNEKAGECVQVCPVDCIVSGEEQYFIDPMRCIDCGACQTVCPVGAIYFEEQLSGDGLHFLQKAKEFFRNF